LAAKYLRSKIDSCTYRSQKNGDQGMNTEANRGFAQQSAHLRRENEFDQVLSEDNPQSCASWVASAINNIQFLCFQPSGPNRAHAEMVIFYRRGN
jgi:hypothetical protein